MSECAAKSTPPVWRKLLEELNGYSGRLPDGEHGVRDIDAPCDMFDPKPESPTGGFVWGDCDTNGHHLCIECVHISLEAMENRRNPT